MTFSATTIGFSTRLEVAGSNNTAENIEPGSKPSSTALRADISLDKITTGTFLNNTPAITGDRGRRSAALQNH
ncbi:MAG TPA: hypothetical protein VKA07_02725 [Candidatus Sulfotelmatobacter sp.]|nr:hypothetical protein [Candidatus Sulfotelmatobacter sp.]